jgi:hypothetical protein
VVADHGRHSKDQFGAADVVPGRRGTKMTIQTLGASSVPGARVATSAERKKGGDWNRPKAGELTANEMSLMDAILNRLPEGAETVAIYLDGHPDTVTGLASLRDRGLIRFVAPVSLGMAAIIGRPTVKR